MKYITVFTDEQKSDYNIVVSDKCSYNITVTDSFNKSRIVITSPCKSFTFNLFCQTSFWIARNSVGCRDVSRDVSICSYYDLVSEKYCYLFFYQAQTDIKGTPLDIIFCDSYNNDAVLEITFNSDKKIVVDMVGLSRKADLPVSEADFPIINDIYNFDFSSLQKLSFPKHSGPAICACGFVNEYSNEENYVCQQCKIWKHVAT